MESIWASGAPTTIGRNSERRYERSNFQIVLQLLRHVIDFYVKVDKTDWKRHANPAIVNAFYSALENSIQFPAGILQVKANVI